nr:putative ribonuclease h protein [Quercus suber]
MEEQMWQQRSRTHWLVSGDSNKKYFHNRASQRFHHNSISELRDSNGDLFLGEENVSTMIVDFYTKLFSSSNLSGLETVVQHTKRVPNALVWPTKRSGQFSIKMRNKCLCEDLQASESDPESMEVQRSLWKGVWRLNVPGKIKHFLWKSCTNSLPTKENMLKKTIIPENVCHLCSEHPEDVMHALLGCTKVRQVWQRSFGRLEHNRVAEGSFPGLVHLVQTKLSLFPLFAVTAWAIWHHRNKSQLQAVAIPTNRLAVFAKKISA